MTSTAERTTAVVLALAGGGVGYLAGTRPWLRLASHAWTGAEATGGLLPALCLAILAGAGLTLLVHTLGLRIIGVLHLLLGTSLVVAALRYSARPAVEGTPGAALTGAHWLAVAGGCLVAVSGLVTVLRAGGWPVRRSARFDSRDAVTPATLDNTDPLSVWRALDDGRDPTDMGDTVSTAESPSPRQHAETPSRSADEPHP